MKKFIIYILLVVAAITAYSSLKCDVSKTRAVKRIPSVTRTTRTITSSGRGDYKTMQVVSHNDAILEPDPDFATTGPIKLKAKKAGVAGFTIYGIKEDGVEDSVTKTIKVIK